MISNDFSGQLSLVYVESWSEVDILTKNHVCFGQKLHILTSDDFQWSQMTLEVDLPESTLKSSQYPCKKSGP